MNQDQCEGNKVDLKISTKEFKGWMEDFPRAVKHSGTVFGRKSGRKFKTDN